LVVFALVAISFVNASFNYDVFPETNTLTLQQGTSYTLYLDYKLYFDTEVDFYFSNFAPKGIILNHSSKISTSRDFTLPLYFNVSDLSPGDYEVVFSSKMLYNGVVENKEIPFIIKVVKREKYVYASSNYTNALPNLELKEISTRNLLLDNTSQNVLLKFVNTGSSATFKIFAIIDSPDKNKVILNFNKSYFDLQNNEETNIILNVRLDENYSILHTPIYLVAQEISSSKQYGLGQLNLTLKTTNLLLAFMKEENKLNITNVGTSVSNIDVNTNSKSFDFILMPNQTYSLNFDSNDSSADVYVDGNFYDSILFSGINKEVIPKFGDKVSGLFSFGSTSVTWTIVLLFIVALVAIIYKAFFARRALFSNNVYFKDIQKEE